MSMTIVRPHRASLADSLALSKPCTTFKRLLEIMEEGGWKVNPKDVMVSFYAYDPRIDQTVFVVVIRGQGVWGMTDGALP